jgi:hypothetical protein
MRVEVYWNLTRNCWSIRDVATGRIHAHADKVSVRGAQFVVQPAGRARVLRERKKNVHAFVRGELAVFSSEGIEGEWLAATPRQWNAVTYNPYQDESFMRLEKGQRVEPIKWSPFVEMGITLDKPTVFAGGDYA